MTDDGESDVHRRAERAFLDVQQTHLTDHDPDLVARRRDKMRGEWGPWHSPRARTDGGDPG